MLNIEIIAIGKLTEKHLRPAVEEYLKRLSPYAKLLITELPTSGFGTANREKAKKEEGARILTALEKQKDSHIIFLSEKGGKYNSVELAGHISKISRKIVFVIAGPLGFDNKIDFQPSEWISLSDLTFSHGLARLILLEQIFRASTIITKKTYHY